MAERAKIDELVRLITARVTAAPSSRPNIKLVSTEVSPSHRMCSVSREAHVRRITDLKRFYRLQWLVDQATFNVGTIDDLDDKGLVALLDDCERARECILEDVSFEDAGLVRTAKAIDGDLG